MYFLVKLSKVVNIRDCCNLHLVWPLQVVNAFSCIVEDEIRTKVIQRLRDIVQLQDMLRSILPGCLNICFSFTNCGEPINSQYNVVRYVTVAVTVTVNV